MTDAGRRKKRLAGGKSAIPLVDGQLEVFELITRGACVESVLARIAEIADGELDPVRVSIDLVDSASGGLRNVAGPGLPAGYRDRIAMRVEGAETDGGPRRRLSARREPPDSIEDRLAAHIRRASLGVGMADCQPQPIRASQGDLAGFLTLHGKARRGSRRAERLEPLIRLARIAIDSARREQSADQRFATLAATIPGVVYQRLVSPDGDIRYVYISEGARDLFGVEPDRILADPQALFDRHGPEYRETFRDRLLAASKSLTLWDVEAQIVTPDGKEKWTHAIARPHRQPDGSVLWTGVILDATRIKKAELDLRRAKEEAEEVHRAQAELVAKVRNADQRFATLAQTIPGVVYQRLVTPDGDIRYTYISDGVRELFGVEPKEILADSQALFDCHGPEYRKTFRQRLMAASRSLSLWDVEAQIVTADGKEKWIHAIARPHRQPDGSVLWDGVILDATRIKEAELALRRAKEAAETASRAKTQFLASMSHELRTPLNAVIGFSEILHSEAYGPLGNRDYVQYAGFVHQSAHSLLETINSILEFTKFESYGVEINDSTVLIGGVIDVAVRQVHGLVDEAGIEIATFVSNDLPVLICDEDMIRRMLVHLLSNAVKFTPEGGRIEISAESLATGELVVTVSDNGIGIAKEDMPKIFEAFGQIDGALSRRYGGSGLGVPLAVAMARLHGAELSFESEVGRGTTVTVMFPKERVIGSARRVVSR